MFDIEKEIKTIQKSTAKLSELILEFTEAVNKTNQSILNYNKAMFSDLFKTVCSHESDGIEHVLHDEGGSLSMSKCKKCNQFYKSTQK